MYMRSTDMFDPLCESKMEWIRTENIQAEDKHQLRFGPCLKPGGEIVNDIPRCFCNCYYIDVPGLVGTPPEDNSVEYAEYTAYGNQARRIFLQPSTDTDFITEIFVHYGRNPVLPCHTTNLFDDYCGWAWFDEYTTHRFPFAYLITNPVGIRTTTISAKLVISFDYPGIAYHYTANATYLCDDFKSTGGEFTLDVAAVTSYRGSFYGPGWPPTIKVHSFDASSSSGDQVCDQDTDPVSIPLPCGYCIYQSQGFTLWVPAVGFGTQNQCTGDCSCAYPDYYPSDVGQTFQAQVITTKTVCTSS